MRKGSGTLLIMLWDNIKSSETVNCVFILLYKCNLTNLFLLELEFQFEYKIQIQIVNEQSFINNDNAFDPWLRCFEKSKSQDVGVHKLNKILYFMHLVYSNQSLSTNGQTPSLFWRLLSAFLIAIITEWTDLQTWVLS